MYYPICTNLMKFAERLITYQDSYFKLHTVQIGPSRELGLLKLDRHARFLGPVTQSSHVQGAAAFLAGIVDFVQIVTGERWYSDRDVGHHTEGVVIQQFHGVVQVLSQNQPFVRLIVHQVFRGLKQNNKLEEEFNLHSYY